MSDSATVQTEKTIKPEIASDLATILELLTHERPEVRKRAVDILAVTTATDEDLVAAVSTTVNVPRLIALLTPDNRLLHGTLLMTLINMCASKKHGTEVSRVLCECHCIQRVMRLLTASEEPSEAVSDLMLMLITNITSTGGSIAANALLQMEAGADTRGYFLDAILQRMVQLTCSASTGKWILNIITNMTSEEVAQQAVVEHPEAIQLLTKCIIMCDPITNTFYALSIFRNLALAADGKYHQKLIDANVPQVVLENLRLDRPKGNTDMCSAYVEFLFMLCTSKVGVEFMEQVNGKKTLVEVAENEGHTLRSEDCADSRTLLEKRVLSVLDDIQDTVVIE